MKTEIKTSKKAFPQFPRLMSSKEGNVIVLVHAKEGNDLKGTLVAKHRETSSIYNIGEYRTDWIADYFKDFEGEIILANE